MLAAVNNINVKFLCNSKRCICNLKSLCDLPCVNISNSFILWLETITQSVFHFKIYNKKQYIITYKILYNEKRNRRNTIIN